MGKVPFGVRFDQGIHHFQVHRFAGAPGSLVRSRTAMDLTLAGNAARKWLADSGWYRRTWSTPTFSPLFAHSDNGGLAGGLRTGTHQNDDPLGRGSPK
jgi:hypothetical protein